jgi:hypothetical protein
LAIALSPDEVALTVGSCWVVRATHRNQTLLRRYPHIFDSRFPGSSLAWTSALTLGTAFPDEPGFVWCDIACARLFARRRAGDVRTAS